MDLFLGEFGRDGQWICKKKLKQAARFCRPLLSMMPYEKLYRALKFMENLLE